MSSSDAPAPAFKPAAVDPTAPRHKPKARGDDPARPTPRFILSFDIEEHDRIESAAGLAVPPELSALYKTRAVDATDWLLGQLARHAATATFFILGEFAAQHPGLVRSIHDAGHEVASHGWNHRSLRRLSPAEVRNDIRQTKDTLEQIIAAPVLGYRAPTFSIVRSTAWAIDLLVEEGYAYDSSIYPVRHDRYGIPDAPRFPFRACGHRHTILELPPASYRLLGSNIPTGGGGYFRLLPLEATRATLRQVARTGSPPVAMLYYHPWEFDPDIPRLPLRGASQLRTYIGLSRTRKRLDSLLSRQSFVRARDVIPSLSGLPSYEISAARPGADVEPTD